jgi:cell division protein FtsX
LIRFLHITIISILLWILGLIALSLIKGAGIEQDLQANASYIAELNPSILPGQRIVAESLIKEMPQVRAGTVELINKEEAKEMMLSDFPHLANAAIENPFRDIIRFNTTNIKKEGVVSLETAILKIQGVAAFYYEQEVYKGLKSGLGRFRWALIGLSSILLLSVITMIIYALNRVLIQNKKNSRIMHLAGVQDQDIMAPYIKSGLKTSLICASISIVILILNILFINRTLLVGVEISFLQAIIACIFVLLMSVLLYLTTTYYSTRSFIQQF